MKKLYLIMAAITLGYAFMLSGTAFAGSITDRQICQRKRIHEGVASGQLNWKEMEVLAREQRRIQRLKRKVWRDGVLTPREHALVMYEQDRSSAHIYRLKHNGI